MALVVCSHVTPGGVSSLSPDVTALSLVGVNRLLMMSSPVDQSEGRKASARVTSHVNKQNGGHLL